MNPSPGKEAEDLMELVGRISQEYGARLGLQPQAWTVERGNLG